VDPAYATARDLSHLYRVPLGTVYYWASADRWRRTTGRPKGYHRSDAQRSYDRRHVPPGLTRC
jgi:hypothetical protein